MGKEAKIGLAVIAILLTVFTVVLVKKLTGPGDSGQQATDDDKENGESDSDDKTDRSSDKPTLVNLPGSSHEPPDGSSTGTNDWQYDDPVQGGNPHPGMGFRRTYGTPEGAAADEPTASDNAQNAPQPPLPDNWRNPGSNASDPPNTSPESYRPLHPLRSPPAGGRVDGSLNPIRVLPPPYRSPQDSATGSSGYPDPVDSPSAVPGAQPVDTDLQGSRGDIIPSDNVPWRNLTGGAGSANANSGSEYPPRNPADYSSRYSEQFSQQSTTPNSIPHVSQYGPPYGSPYDATTTRAADGKYEVQPNDSYWVISGKLYGTGSYFRALAEHNRSRIPREDRLDVGDVILAPDLAQLEKTYPDLCPKPERRETILKRATAVSTNRSYAAGRTYKVEEGDTLFDIAKHELGDVKRWVEIYNLNRDLIGKDYHYVTPGLELALPGGEPADSVTQRPDTLGAFRQ